MALPDVDPKAVTSVLNLCNPFQDQPINPVGWPDSKAVPSLIMVDTQEATIKQPAGLAAGDTWDMHVGILPLAFQMSTAVSAGGTVLANGVFSAAPVASQVYGPYVVFTGATGANLTFTPKQAAATAAFEGSYGTLAQGSQFRVVAQAIEVVNTSADLYRNGMAYAYRTSGESTPGYYLPTASPATSAIGQVAVINRPPSSYNGILNIKTTYEGDGRDGLYIINTPSKFVNPVKANFGATAVFSNQSGSLQEDVTYTQGAGPLNDWNVIGGFISGISQNSSFVVRFRTVIEIFPGVSENNGLIRLASAPVPYSPLIEEILTRVLAEMPAGCAYTENPFGEWFSKVVDAVADYAPQIGGALGTVLPGVGLAGKVLGLGARGLSGLVSQKQKDDARKKVKSDVIQKVKGLQTPNRTRTMKISNPRVAKK